MVPSIGSPAEASTDGQSCRPALLQISARSCSIKSRSRLLRLTASTIRCQSTSYCAVNKATAQAALTGDSNQKNLVGTPNSAPTYVSHRYDSARCRSAACVESNDDSQSARVFTGAIVYRMKRSLLMQARITVEKDQQKLDHICNTVRKNRNHQGSPGG